MRQLLGMMFLIAVCAFWGCEYETETPTLDDQTTAETAVTELPATQPAESGLEVAPPADAPKAEEEIELEFSPETTGGDEPVVTEKKAEAGVTHKGEFANSSNHPMSIVTVPLATYFTAKEKTVFDIQIPSAMNLYKATNGEFPKTEEVFMSDIIEANQIHLPELKEGDEYFYDPETAELMVRSKE